MKVVYTARKADISDQEKGKAQRKLDKVHRILGGNRSLEAHVVLSRNGHGCDAEVTLRALHHTLVVNGANAQPFGALTIALAKLEKQAVRNKHKLIDKSRRGARDGAPPAGPQAVAPAPEVGAAAKPVVRAARIAPKPMTLEEATLQIESGGAHHVTYRDAKTGAVCVLLRRTDGVLELVET
jgi:putative sigma-54 modulation protein